jgi:hypothetical protein
MRALVTGGLSAADKKRIYAGAERVLMVPRISDDGQVVNYVWFWPSNDAWAAHAVRLLELSHLADLRQCQWKRCNLEDVIEDDRAGEAAAKLLLPSRIKGRASL